MRSIDMDSPDVSHIYSVRQLLDDGFRGTMHVFGEITGLPTGFTDLDHSLGGLKKGDLIIVGGRPSMGKSSLAINIAQYAALTMGLPVMIFSMSVSAIQLTARLISTRCEIDQTRLRCGRLTQDEERRLSNSIERFRFTQILIDETVPSSGLELYERATQIHKITGLTSCLIVVDGVGVMTDNSEFRASNNVNATSDISRSLKNLAKALPAQSGWM